MEGDESAGVTVNEFVVTTVDEEQVAADDFIELVQKQLEREKGVGMKVEEVIVNERGCKVTASEL